MAECDFTITVPPGNIFKGQQVTFGISPELRFPCTVVVTLNGQRFQSGDNNGQFHMMSGVSSQGSIVLSALENFPRGILRITKTCPAGGDEPACGPTTKELQIGAPAHAAKPATVGGIAEEVVKTIALPVSFPIYLILGIPYIWVTGRKFDWWVKNIFPQWLF